jgi:hypothetical protein
VFERDQMNDRLKKKLDADTMGAAADSLHNDVSALQKKLDNRMGRGEKSGVKNRASFF